MRCSSLVKGRSDSACYYGAYLQRLISRQWPDLVQPPPSIPTSALHPQNAQRNKQAAISVKKKQLAISASQELRIELDSKMKDLFDARYMRLEARYTELEELAMQNDHDRRNLERDKEKLYATKLLNKAVLIQKSEKNDELQRSNLDPKMKKEHFDVRSNQSDARSMQLEAKSAWLDARTKQLDSRHIQLEARSVYLEAKSKRLVARWKQVDARWKQVEARSAEFGARSEQFDARHLQLEARSMELEVKSRSLGARSEELESG